MTSTAAYFTKSFPMQADITGWPKQAYHMQDTRVKYCQYVLGGITAGTIVALGTIASSGTVQYLYAPHIHHDLGGKPIGIDGTMSNKIGKFICVHVKLSKFILFPFVEAVFSMNVMFKHTNVSHFFAKHLEHTTNWKIMADPIRGTLLPVFYIIYFGQDIPRGSILSNDEKMNMAKIGPGHGLWVSMVSDAIDNIYDINAVIDAFSKVGDC